VDQKGCLTIVGFGFHDGHLTLETLEALKQATKIFYVGFRSGLANQAELVLVVAWWTVVSPGRTIRSARQQRPQA
jgi:diphthamide biosynthesis methyltransferase